MYLYFYFYLNFTHRNSEKMKLMFIFSIFTFLSISIYTYSYTYFVQLGDTTKPHQTTWKFEKSPLRRAARMAPVQEIRDRRSGRARGDYRGMKNGLA